MAVAAARASTAWAWATAAQTARGGLAVSLAEQPVRLGGQFPGAAVVLWSAHRCSTYLVVLALGLIPRTPPGELPFRWHARHGNRARNRAGGRERKPEAATNVSAAWEGCDDNRRPIQPGGRQGLYCPAWFSRRLPVLTCYPAACHKPPGEHRPAGWPRS